MAVNREHCNQDNANNANNNANNANNNANNNAKLL